MAQIDQEQATQIANAYLKSLGDYSASGGLMLQEQFTREKPYGWIFFYNTRTYIETGNFLHALTSAAPFLVERDGGGVYSFGTTQPLDDAIAEYERTHPFAATPAASGDQPATGIPVPGVPAVPADQPAQPPETFPSAPAQSAGTPQPFAPSQPLVTMGTYAPPPSQPPGAMGPYAPPPSQPLAGAMPQPDAAPGVYPGAPYPPGAYPYGAYPTGAYPPGMYAPGGYPQTGAYPPGSYPTGGYPPGAFPPGAYPTGAYPTGAYPTGAYAPPMGAPPQSASSPARWIIPVAIGAALLIILVTFLVGSNLITQAQHASATATSIAQTTGTAQAAATNFANEVTQEAISNNATATAQAVAASRPYHAAIPGPCDTGGATWETFDNTNTSCTGSELEMVSTSSTKEGEVAFRAYGDFPFPNDVKVEVTVRAPQTCAGIVLRVPSGSPGGYGFLICSNNGYWDLIRYATDGTPTDLATGYVAVLSSYHIQAIAKGTTLTFIVNGQTLSNEADGTFTTNNIIGLEVGAINEPGPAYFSNFTFTPLSQG